MDMLLTMLLRLHCCLYMHQLSSSEQEYDVVLANILRGPLMELQPRLTGYCKPGGWLVLSGILTEQVGMCSSSCSIAVAMSALLAGAS
jgi:ribosomal protein L11 methylase PrmA